MRTKAEKIKDFFHQFSSTDRVLVVISADPDAIASAMAVGRLLSRKVEGITISNVNPIDRPDNLAMIRLLKVALVPFEDIKLSRFTKVVIVDSQPCHHKLMAGLKPHVVIDHHPDTAPRAPFTDIRTKYGATATILTEYLRAAQDHSAHQPGDCALPRHQDRHRQLQAPDADRGHRGFSVSLPVRQHCARAPNRSGRTAL